VKIVLDEVDISEPVAMSPVDGPAFDTLQRYECSLTCVHVSV